jgi:hypothetical protein
MDRLILPDPYTIRKQCFENLFENECYVYNRVGHSVFVSEFTSQFLHENDPDCICAKDTKVCTLSNVTIGSMSHATLDSTSFIEKPRYI